MFKFKLGRKQPEETEGRRRFQKDSFHLNKLCDRGFPSRPSSIAYDPQLKLIAIGTHTGDIRIYGQAAFQLSYHFDSSSIRKLIFFNGLARLLVLTFDGYLHLIEINNSNEIRIDLICTSNEENQNLFQQIQTLCLLRNNKNLLIGLDNGDIYSFNIDNFSLNTNAIIPTNIIEKTIVQYCSGRIIHPGSVQSIVQHPTNDDKILIGYKNMLIVHWDLPSNSHDRTYIYRQEVESVCWYNQGMNFATCHSNGSYALWDAKQQLNIVETEKIPYGPYPCTPMKKISVKIMRNGDPLIIFSGGLPRSSYANKHSVSCLCENEHNSERTRHVTFDFTSEVIDYFTIDKTPNEIHDEPQALVVLLNEEIIVIDLITDSWPLYNLPYLNSIHASPVICTTIVCNVNFEFYKTLVNYGAVQFEDYSDRKWPIVGGEIHQIDGQSQEKHLLLTGHEDGSVQFWDVTNISMPLIYKLKTSDYFQIEQAPKDDIDEETWPPFRKTGSYDPYCDDPRLAIQKIVLCTNTDTLVVAGTAGQVLTFRFTSTSSEINLTTTMVNLLEGCENFVWRSHEEMKPKATLTSAGFVGTSLIQLYPPAAVSALALCSDIQTYSVGTAHGFALIDYSTDRILIAKCTLDPHTIDSANINLPITNGQSSLIRGRSLKKSLRESFRRFRKGRTIKKSIVQRIDENQLEDIKRIPIERQVESREFKQNDDQNNTMVRCLYFAKTYLSSTTDQTRSLWIGTNHGHVFVYSLIGFESTITDGPTIEADKTRSCSLAKEIRLKHKAPVLNIAVLNNSNRSIEQGSNTSSDLQISTTNSENSNSHKVLICSEEQLKIFTLPNLKPFCKYKLTATEGTRVRKINVNQFSLKKDNSNESYSESCLICLDNMGQISIYSLPILRRQVLFNCIKPTDINAISSFQFTSYGHAFYLQSSSEYKHITFSDQKHLSYSMMISYDKFQRQTIVRSIDEKTTKTNDTLIAYKKDQDTPSKDSIASSIPPKSIDINKIENEEPVSMSTVKSDHNINNSGFSTNSDSAIDINSINIINNQPINDDVKKSIENSPSTLIKHNESSSFSIPESQQSISPKSSKKSPAPPPPPPKPVKLTSVKARQAPTINGTTNNQISTQIMSTTNS